MDWLATHKIRDAGFKKEKKTPKKIYIIKKWHENDMIPDR